MKHKWMDTSERRIDIEQLDYVLVYDSRATTMSDNGMSDHVGYGIVMTEVTDQAGTCDVFLNTGKILEGVKLSKLEYHSDANREAWERDNEITH